VADCPPPDRTCRGWLGPPPRAGISGRAISLLQVEAASPLRQFSVLKSTEDRSPLPSGTASPFKFSTARRSGRLIVCAPCDAGFPKNNSWKNAALSPDLARSLRRNRVSGSSRVTVSPFRGAFPRAGPLFSVVLSCPVSTPGRCSPGELPGPRRAPDAPAAVFDPLLPNNDSSAGR